MNELHSDLANSGIEGILDDNDRVTIGHESFRKLLKKEIPCLKKATAKHMQMCCCHICLTAMKFQEVLNSFRRKKINSLETELFISKAKEKDTTNKTPAFIEMLKKKIMI